MKKGMWRGVGKSVEREREERGREIKVAGVVSLRGVSYRPPLGSAYQETPPPCDLSPALPSKPRRMQTTTWPVR